MKLLITPELKTFIISLSGKMINSHYKFIVSNDLKYEYQEGTVKEIQFNCAEGTQIMVRFFFDKFLTKL